MIFRSLVENLIREPGDSLVVRSLIRELERDLIAAFQLSRPLVDKYPDMFWQSHSYLDFLIQISNLPSYKQYYCGRRENSEPSKSAESLENNFSEWEDEKQRYKNKLSNWENRFKNKLSEWQNEQQHFEHKLSECESEKQNLRVNLSECESEKQNLRENLLKCESEKQNLQENVSKCEKEKQNLLEKLSENESEKQNLQKKIMSLEKYKSQNESQNQNKIHSLQSNLDQCQSECESLKLQLQKYEEVTSVWKERIEQEKSYLTRVGRTYLDKFQSESEQNKELVDHYRELIALYESGWVQSSNELSTRQSELQKTRNDLLHCQSTLKSYESAIQTIQDNHNSRMTEIGSKIFSLENTIEQLRQTNRELINNRSDDSNNNMEMESTEQRIKREIPESPVSMKKRMLISVPNFLSPKNEDETSSTEEKIFLDDTLIDALKKVYSTVDECGDNWEDNVRFHLLQDLELLKIFRKQLEILKNDFHMIEINPEDFADMVLDLYKKAPQHLKSLEIIAEAASLSDIENIVEEITSRLNFISKLYTPFRDTDYIKWTEIFPVKLKQLWNYFTDIDDWISLYTACEKLARYFQITLNPSTLTESIDKHIKTVLNTESIANTFEEQIENHRANLTNKTNAQIEELTKRLDKQGLDFNIVRDTYVSKIAEMKQKNDACEEFYETCLNILQMAAGTSKESFLERLKEKMNTTLKRSCSDENENEKKRKIERSYTFIEMQNLFDALYKEHFRMKWLYFNDTYPKEEMVIDKLTNKLELLQQFNATSRGSELLKILLRYVELDLAVFTDKQHLFTEIVSIEKMLDIVMKSTEDYIKKLKENPEKN